MRKQRGTILIVLGLLLLFGAAGLAVYNLNQDARAGEQSDAALEEIAEYLKHVPVKVVSPNAPVEEEEELVPLDLDGYQYLGLITIPALELQLPVQLEWSYPNLKVSPCRMTGSTATEDLVIIAHNYAHHFGTINQLEPGDEVSVTLVSGKTYVYTVDAKEIVPPTAVEDVTSGEWPLTLFTCTIGGRTRQVIRCDAAQ